MLLKHKLEVTQNIPHLDVAVKTAMKGALDFIKDEMKKQLKILIWRNLNISLRTLLISQRDEYEDVVYIYLFDMEVTVE